MNVSTLIVSSDPNSITLVEPFLRSAGLATMLDAVRYHDVVLGITEAVNNAIVHGNKLVSANDVTIDLHVSESTIVISVLDCGAGFNPDSIADPTDGDNVYKEGGRGVFLMKHYADAVSFEQTTNGMRVVLTYRL